MRARVCKLVELCPQITVEQVQQALKENFAREYGAYQEYVFDTAAEEEISSLYEEQASWEWRLGKAPKFDYQLEERLSFGEIQLLFGLEQGRITELRVYSDALDTTVTQRIAQALLGGRFVAEEMAGNLAEAAAQQEDPMLQELAEYMRSIAL